MTIEEFAARLAAINAYAVIEDNRVRIQVTRDGKAPADGFFYGDTAENLLAKAEAYAAKPAPGDAEYAAWFQPEPLRRAA